MSLTEPGLGPLRRTHHYARIPGGENRPLCLWSKDPATHESKQQSERWAEAHAEKGTHRAPPVRSLTSRARLEGAGAQRSAEHFSCTVRTLSGVEAQPVFSNHGRTTWIGMLCGTIRLLWHPAGLPSVMASMFNFQSLNVNQRFLFCFFFPFCVCVFWFNTKVTFPT